MQKFIVNEKDYFLPLNRNYRSWGQIIHESENVLIISVDFDQMSGVVSVFKEDAVSIVKFFKGKKSVVQFKDYHFKDKIFIREFINGEKFYIKNSRGDLILKTKPIKVKYLQKLIPPFGGGADNKKGGVP